MTQEIKKTSDTWNRENWTFNATCLSIKTGFTSLDLSPLDTAILCFMDAKHGKAGNLLGTIELTHDEIYEALKAHPKFNPSEHRGQKQ